MSRAAAHAALGHREEIARRLVVLFGRRGLEEMAAGDIIADKECVGDGEIAADDAAALAAPEPAPSWASCFKGSVSVIGPGAMTAGGRV